MSSRQSSVRYDADRGGVLLELSERRFQVREGGIQILLVVRIAATAGGKTARKGSKNLDERAGEGQGSKANVWGIAWEKCMEGKNCTGAGKELEAEEGAAPTF
jgi:hypothetical protein